MAESVLEIDGVAHGGDGVGRIDGQVCFVPLGLPGDVLRVRITHQGKRLLRGEIAEVIEASPHRVSAACTNHGTCGACAWGHFAYPAQAEWKRRIVAEALQRIAGVTIEPEWKEDPGLRLGYRTRAEFHGNGEHLGFFARASHDVVDTTAHPLCHSRVNEALAVLRPLRLKGSVTVTVNPEGKDTFIWTKYPQRKIRDRFPGADSANDDPLRPSTFTFDGAPIVNGSFCQSSLLLNRLLLEEVRKALGKPVSVLDLYCGNGNLSMGLEEATRVVGMDHNRQAVRAARNAHERDYRAGGEEKMAKLIRDDEWDTVLLDPPRSGAKALMSALAKSHPRAIVYVSCDPATLARDVAVLTAEGWKLTRATAIDLFPHTPHVETVCRLER